MMGWILHRVGWFVARCAITWGFCWTLQSIIYQETHNVIGLHVLVIGSAMAIVLMRLWMPSNKD